MKTGNRGKNMEERILAGKREKRDRNRVLLILAISFLAVLAFNILTPMMTDDYSYGAQVASADGILDLIRQEQNQYMTWNGRSVVHFLLRLMLSCPVMVFNVLNSIVFAVLSICMYMQIEHRKKWDVPVMLMIHLGLWMFTVDFSETVLWETGACNYLWGTTIILLFMTLLARKCMKDGEETDGLDRKQRHRKELLPALFFLFFGVIAGWCNENTSGGCLLYLLFLLWRTRNRRVRTPRYLTTGILGNIIGLFMMVHAPGNANRAQFQEENHSGLFGIVSRFQKATLTIHDYFFVLLVILLAASVLLILQERNEWKAYRAGDKETALGALLLPFRNSILFVFLFFATAYALIMTAQPQPRAYFGAGIFLLIAVIQSVQEALNSERRKDSSIFIRGGAYIGMGALLLLMSFTYIDCGAQLMRIKRDSDERVAYILEKKAQGEEEIYVAQLHPAFENRYTVAYESDLRDNFEYWTNVAYETYFDVPRIIAVPYDDWKLIR